MNMYVSVLAVLCVALAANAELNFEQIAKDCECDEEKMMAIVAGGEFDNDAARCVSCMGKATGIFDDTGKLNEDKFREMATANGAEDDMQKKAIACLNEPSSDDGENAIGLLIKRCIDKMMAD